MTILNAMYSGVSGLSAEGEALGVIGDNVANTNTVGFKESRAVFENVLGGAVGDPKAPGAGVEMTRSQQIFAQGTLLSTGQATDLALSGDGFFVVNGKLDGIAGTYYTRNGQTHLQNDGTLVNPDGLALQGYPMQNGTLSKTLGPIKVQTASLSPKATTTLHITANLDATATPPALPWDPQNPGATSNFSTSMQVFDSLGNAHTVDVYMRANGSGAWDFHAIAPGADVQGGTPGQNVEIETGTLSFTSNGALQSVAVTGGGTVSFNNATANQALTLDFGQPISAGGTGLDGTTQFGSPSNVSAQSQDGYASGDLSNVKIDPDGTVRGVYTNGQEIAVGQLAIAKFRSDDGLGRAGHNLWTATTASGDAALGAAGSGGRGGITSGALEQSNVDVAQQFVELIAHQRSFQANSKTIQTADQMLQELMQLKQ